MAKGLSSSKTRKETHLLFDGSRVLQTYQANLVNNAEVMLEDPFSGNERSHNLLQKKALFFCHFLWQDQFVKCQEIQIHALNVLKEKGKPMVENGLFEYVVETLCFVLSFHTCLNNREM